MEQQNIINLKTALDNTNKNQIEKKKKSPGRNSDDKKKKWRGKYCQFNIK